MKKDELYNGSKALTLLTTTTGGTFLVSKTAIKAVEQHELFPLDADSFNQFNIAAKSIGIEYQDTRGNIAVFNDNQLKVFYGLCKLLADDYFPTKDRIGDNMNEYLDNVHKGNFNNSFTLNLNNDRARLQKIIYGKISGSQTTYLTKAILDLASVRVNCTYEQNGEKRFFNEPLLSVKYGGRVTETGEKTIEDINIKISDLFLFNVRSNYVQLPNNFFPRINAVGGGNTLFWNLFNFLLTRQHNPDCKLNDETIIKQIINGAGQYYRIAKGKEYLRKDRYEKDKKKAFEDLKNIGFVENITESKNAQGGKKYTFYFSPETWNKTSQTEK